MATKSTTNDAAKKEAVKKLLHTKDSVQNVIGKLQKDSIAMAKDIEGLRKDSANLAIQVENLTRAKDSLTVELQEAKAKESPITAITSPSGCAVLVVLIIAVAIVVLKKGLTVSKGDTKISLEEDQIEKNN